ncbi:helix-turn-helix transcriptional regulator [Glutamicibacter sp. JL.03c]|uniref:helix-turn-helix transcriptional regulator n=1 Tax=Glutamicibacter sp. JL.03c TaxID=2984842 RepID=UPI0021F777F1|nr:helix-turn-helix transcriptional regulator [Glutamicibacter sp. JL.03c]UYQ77769.1 helix-turn-helix transcriptional regulator [Glutamicibacter sp. JL.03c]
MKSQASDIDAPVLPEQPHRPHVGARTERYPDGVHIASHWHDEDQLVYVSTGLMAIHTSHGVWVASPGRAFLIPAGVKHEHRTYGNTLLHLFNSAGPGLVARGLAGPEVVAVDALLHEVLKAVTDPALSEEEVAHLECVLNDRVRRTPVTGLRLPQPNDPRLREACRLVQDDLGDVYTLPRLARSVHVSERTLARLFKAEFGQTYPQWRTRARLFASMVRLAEGHTVTQVAQECGWSTPSAFIDTFRRIMGQTPGAFKAADSTDW